MKALLLGGTGSFGKNAAALLAHESLITKIGIASRNLENAQQAANELGSKGHAVCVDIQDLTKLSTIASDYDIIVNAAGPTSEVQVPALQAAIDAGVHYCDLGVTGKSAQSALQLDTQAQARRVTAIISTGWFTILNLMAVHAVGQLDETKQVTDCMLADYTPREYFSPEQSLARARKAGRIETSWDVIETAGEPVLTYRAGRWIRLEPLENPIDVIHPTGNKITAYLMDSPSILTLPAHLPGVQNVTCLLGMIPPQLMNLFIQKSQRIARGELDWRGAALDFFETAVEDKKRWLISPTGYPRGWGMWVAAEGYKDKREARYLCWPSMFLNWTCVPLVIVALRILRGEVSQNGVLPSEACFDLASFFDEVSKYIPEEHLGKPLLNERIDWLE